MQDRLKLIFGLMNIFRDLAGSRKTSPCLGDVGRMLGKGKYSILSIFPSTGTCMQILREGARGLPLRLKAPIYIHGAP